MTARLPCMTYPEDAEYKTIAVRCEKCGTVDCWLGYLRWEVEKGIDLNKNLHHLVQAIPDVQRERLARDAQLRCVNSTVQPGQVWKHSKSGTSYEIVCLSVDEVRLVPLVTYRNREGWTWTRELSVFLENVDGPRFIRVW